MLNSTYQSSQGMCLYLFFLNILTIFHFHLFLSSLSISPSLNSFLFYFLSPASLSSPPSSFPLLLSPAPLLFILLQRQRYRKRERLGQGHRERSPLHQLAPEMPTTAEQGLLKARSQKLHQGLLCGYQRNKYLNHRLLHLHMCISWIRSKQTETQTEHWNMGYRHPSWCSNCCAKHSRYFFK